MTSSRIERRCYPLGEDVADAKNINILEKKEIVWYLAEYLLPRIDQTTTEAGGHNNSALESAFFVSFFGDFFASFFLYRI